ncbi:MAG: nitrite reductase [Saprospiraceae bacterium]
MRQDLDLNNVNPEAKKDILELQRRIQAFKTGKEDEERFKLYRLTRGVYGQRQLGVQMFRTKIPFGRLTTHQLIQLANTSEKFTNGNLHLTTRQNIQFHYVKLDDSPAIWKELAEKGVTAREACGNTVRNLTASAKAGIDPDELFDVSPYVQASYEYFLRNPICQEMGRKIKPAFSSSDKDSAYTYFHDFGFIPRLRTNAAGEEERGFKLVVGGGLGAVGMVAQTAYEFIHEDQIIPFMEAAIRVFDRYGEREKRMKARMKFLLKEFGLEKWLEMVEEERLSIKNQVVKIDRYSVPAAIPASAKTPPTTTPNNERKYQRWLESNVFEQKQKGWYAAQLRVQLGNIDAERARKFAALIKDYAADDIRLTVNQGFLIKFLREETLPHLFNELDKLKLAEPGFGTIGDVTACPGTDTCALGVTNSTGLATELEEVIAEEYPQLLNETNINIKISGCMNGCGQHTAAEIGFHGSSIKKRPLVIPAMQVVLGGGVDQEGRGYIAEKVIKVPTKKVPDVLRTLLADYESNSTEGEYFNTYYYRQGKRYFYNLLKELAAIDLEDKNIFFDWGQDHEYRQMIGVGECAGAMLDVVGTIIADARDKVEFAIEALENELFADSIYHSYTAMVVGAKALLLAADVKCNTQRNIIRDFQEHYVKAGKFALEADFNNHVLEMKKHAPSAEFATTYLERAYNFITKVIATREQQLVVTDGEDKLVVESHYKA